MKDSKCFLSRILCLGVKDSRSLLSGVSRRAGSSPRRSFGLTIRSHPMAGGVSSAASTSSPLGAALALPISPDRQEPTVFLEAH